MDGSRLIIGLREEPRPVRVRATSHVSRTSYHDPLTTFLAFLFLILATLAPRGAAAAVKTTLYYPYVEMSVPGDANITFLFNGRSDAASCETLAANVANSMLTVCPTCQTKARTCLDALEPQHRKLLSAAPLDVPSARLPDGVATYHAANPDIALAACRESERQTSSRAEPGRIVCYPPKTVRPLPAFQQTSLNSGQYFYGALFLVLGGLLFGCAYYLIRHHEDVGAWLSGLPRTGKRLIMLGTDIVLLAAALLTALSLQYGMRWPQVEGAELMIALALIIAIPVFIALPMYRAMTRYLDSRAIFVLVSSITVAVLLFTGANHLLGIDIVHAEDQIIFWLLAMLYIGGSRVIAREFLRLSGESDPVTERVIIYGAGSAGAQVVQSLRGKAGLEPVAFVDDNPDLAGSSVYGVRIHRASQLPLLVRQLRVTQVLLAIPLASKVRKKTIFDQLEHLGVRIRTIPRFSALIEGRAKVSDIEDISVEDLVGRDPVAPIARLLSECIESKVVLVTGAGGSIGSELSRQILALAPSKLVLVELSEYALYAINEELTDLKHKFAYSVELVPVLASVLTRNLLRHVLEQHKVDTVYHAAAYKHVPLVESNPVEGIRNNVIGSLRTAEAAVAANVATFVLISTDKAVRPTNIMGASKRLAELIVQAFCRRNKTRFCMVRFGNVIDSSGSVVPLFRRQIQHGGPVTVTHPAITRYFMTIPEAAQLVLQAAAMAKGGDVFVLDMGNQVRILDLARRMIHMSGLTIRDAEHPNGNIDIVFTGLRPGEKLYEELLIGNNAVRTEHPLIMRAAEESMGWSVLAPLLVAIENACNQFDAERAISLVASAVPLASQSADEAIASLEAANSIVQ